MDVGYWMLVFLMGAAWGVLMVKGAEWVTRIEGHNDG